MHAIGTSSTFWFNAVYAHINLVRTILKYTYVLRVLSR